MRQRHGLQGRLPRREELQDAMQHAEALIDRLAHRRLPRQVNLQAQLAGAVYQAAIWQHLEYHSRAVHEQVSRAELQCVTHRRRMLHAQRQRPEYLDALLLCHA